MPFHFCSDELIAILAMIPFIGIFFRRFHTWYHKKTNHPSHALVCDHHVEPVEPATVLVQCAHGKTLLQNCNDCLPWSHEGIEWDEMLLEDIEEKFGSDTVQSLLDHKFFKEFVTDLDEVIWMVNGEGYLQARCNGRIFLRNHEANWEEYVL